MWEGMKIVPATKRTDSSDFVRFTKNCNHCYPINLHGKHKYWEIYLTVLDFWTGQSFPKILYTFY